jgi:HEAT repeat protein
VTGKLTDVVLRRRLVALAGHHGDEAAARHGLIDPAADVRATALGALQRMARLSAGDVEAALGDPSPVVRRRACEASVGLDVTGVMAALSDPDPLVVEAACFALGEGGPGGAVEAVIALAEVGTRHDDPLVREAAIAALGAIGDEAGLATILAALQDKPAVRRRAVIALAPFEGPEVEAALEVARSDRDWQVRQAAEDLS